MADLTNFFGPQGFDPSTVEPDVIPPGDYTVIIADACIKETKNNNGHFIELQLQVLDEGKFKGKTLWDRLNFDNPNEQAVAIAKRSLGALLVAVGIGEFKDTDMLLQKVVIACVKVKDGVDNSIRTYKTTGQAQSATTPVAAPVAPVAPVAEQPVQAVTVAPMVPAGSKTTVAPVIAPETPAPAIQTYAQQPPPLQHGQAPAVAPQLPPADQAVPSSPTAPHTGPPWIK